MQGSGMPLSERNSVQLSVLIAPLHETTESGLFAVPGAASAFVHVSCSRVSQVCRSPNRFSRSALEHDISFVHRSCADVAQAWVAVSASGAGESWLASTVLLWLLPPHAKARVTT